jgi:hypothetical protein
LSKFRKSFQVRVKIRNQFIKPDTSSIATFKRC